MEQHKEIDLLLYYLRLINKYKWIVSSLVVVTFVLSAYIELRKPVLYYARVTALSSGSVGAISPADYLKNLGIPVPGGVGDLSTVTGAIIHSRRMAKDIVEKFGKGPESIVAHCTKGIFVVRVTADDPQFAVNVANFCVANVDKLNNELDISPVKPLLKVLDSSENARPIPRPIAKKAAFSGLVVGLAGCLLVISIDYIKKADKKVTFF